MALHCTALQTQIQIQIPIQEKAVLQDQQVKRRTILRLAHLLVILMMMIQA